MADQTLPADFDVGKHTQLAFATPMVGYQWPDSEALNDALSQAILSREAKAPADSPRSIVGGWQSKLDLFSWPEPAVASLARRIDALVRPVLLGTLSDSARSTVGYRIDGWANVLRDGQYNTIHNHPGSLWSGVYYVHVGEPDPARPKCGDLEFVDPRAGANMVSPAGSLLDRNLRLRPVDGFMVLFPGWLQHFVHPYHGSGERITIAFNLTGGPIPPSPGQQDAAAGEVTKG